MQCYCDVVRILKFRHVRVDIILYFYTCHAYKYALFDKSGARYIFLCVLTTLEYYDFRLRLIILIIL